MVERGVQTMGSELNDIVRRENEWEKQKEPLVCFSSSTFLARSSI